MSAERNKALVRGFFEEVWSKSNVAAVDELLALEFVDRSLLPGQESSREGYKGSITEFRAAFFFDDLTIEDQYKDRAGNISAAASDTIRFSP